MVDLPQPDGPSSATKVPSSQTKLTSSSAVTVLRLTLNCFVRFLRRMPEPMRTSGGAVAGSIGSVSSTALAPGAMSDRARLEVRVLLVDLVDDGQVEQLVGGDLDATELERLERLRQELVGHGHDA